MLNERDLIAEFESAPPEKLAALLAEVTPDGERALRAYLGDERFQRMRTAALRAAGRRGGDKKGNVVVLPGIMGSELTAFRAGVGTPVWLSYYHLFRGWLDYLRLADDGRAPFDPTAGYEARATGILNSYYGELLLRLAANWNVRPFWYDWRQDVTLAAAELESFLYRQFGQGEKVHLVAHSMGGLVARALLRKRQDAAHGGAYDKLGGGRLVMLGTPNYGSFEIPQIFAGIQGTVQKLVRLVAAGRLAFFNTKAVLAGLLTDLDSFPGLYQMLPWPPDEADRAAFDGLYVAQTYAAFNPDLAQSHLNDARDHHTWLSTLIDPDYMIYVAGCLQPTVTGITNLAALTDAASYEWTTAGDGSVPHRLGLLAGVPTYYAATSHVGLLSDPQVLAALDGLLAEGNPDGLLASPPVGRGVADPVGLRQDAQKRSQQEMQVFDDLIRRLRARDTRLRPADPGPPAAAPAAGGEARGGGDDGPNPVPQISPDERRLESLLTAGFLGDDAPAAAAEEQAPPPPAPTVRFRVLCASIADVPAAAPPVDAVAVGSYMGNRPQGAVRALDEALSRALRELGRRRVGEPAPADGPDADSARIPDAERILTQYIDRRVLTGELGKVFLLPDPRVELAAARGAPLPNRVVAVAGMGVIGRCGAPEIAVLARELCWALGRAGKRHLATVLIGSGWDNLSVSDALQAWLRGITEAVTGAADEGLGQHLDAVTFIEDDPRRVHAIDQFLRSDKARGDGRISIAYEPLSAEDQQRMQAEGEEWEKREWRQTWERRMGRPDPAATAPGREPPPTCVTVEVRDGVYRFGALTQDASIPERDVAIDPALVRRANDELAAEGESAKQRERGRFLGQVLIPRDLRDQFFTAAPLVMLLDATTARIHWEMVAQFRANDAWEAAAPAGGAANGAFPLDDFLATARGLTRQLRTQFSQPPEPPPPPRQVLRVLVVADPAADMHLPGAAEEGNEVADLFESFNRFYDGGNRVEVVRLIGPLDATRTNVLREVMSRPYDVLHYAGHCFFNVQNPTLSGWIFSRAETLTANELNRIDHVPKFVFSNACESGITPDRSGDRSEGMAPSFAEAFFQRGVANFVCTAWPVDDLAARQFACRLYAGLLGLQLPDGATQAAGARDDGPQPIYRALHEARRAIAPTFNGAQTWGAYQHYGNPYLRFFDPGRVKPRPTAAGPTAPARAAPGSGPPPAAPPPAPAAPVSFDAVNQALERHEAELRRNPNVLDVRPGYRFADGWITDQPAVVVTVRRKLPPDQVPAGQALPRQLDGVPVDVAPATPVEQLRADRGPEVQGLRAPEDDLALPPRPGAATAEAAEAAEAETRAVTQPYKPPPRVKLAEVAGPLTLTCHASPDAGWPTLKPFLEGVRDHLTVGMYDFTAPHILGTLQGAMKAAGGDLRLILDPGLSLTDGGGDDNPKADDVTEDVVRDRLRAALGKHFDFDWAAVRRQGKTTGGIFPSAYHIKVAVRDGEDFWLSSGNWQSSNQPAIDPLGPDGPPPRVFTTYNREWHVLVEHPGLAGVYEKFLQWDMKQAGPLQATDEERGLPERLPDLLVPAEEELLPRGAPRFFAPKVFRLDGDARVQPLLTPDNYFQYVLPLIQSARRKLYFQNQYIHLTTRQAAEFGQLVEALRQKMADGVDVRIILRDIGDTRKMLAALQQAGFDLSREHPRVQVQKGCHNKGIVVDSETVLLGSHNWSSDGTTRNRDASLIIHAPEVAAYYEQIFLFDWENLAHQRVSGERAMPQLAPAAARGAEPTPAGMTRLPWDAYFED